MLDQDVQSRVDAYRGNPQALQQKYSVSKDLLDLMALQKLTKEKESAARELQMSMAAQQGQGAGTIKDQLQQKALGMTKMELEKQQMELLQQKQQEQQQNMQQLAQSGIAQNPAPNMEEGPGFASGGIIAFAGGGDKGEMKFDESEVRATLLKQGVSPEAVDRFINNRRSQIVSGSAYQQSANPPVTLNPRLTGESPAVGPNSIGGAPTRENISRAMNQVPELKQAVSNAFVTGDVYGRSKDLLAQQGREAAAAGRFSSPAPAEAKPAPAPAPEQTRPVRPAPTIAPVGIATPPAVPPTSQAAQAAQQPAPPEAAAPQPTQPPAGLAALPQAAPAQAPAGLTNIPLGNQRDESGNLLPPEDSTIAAQAARKIMSMLDGTENPKTAAQEIREGFKSEYALTEEEKRDRKQYQDMLRARHAALTNPEELRRERLKQTLLGMAGASNAGIALARGAAAGQNYEAGRNAEALKVLSDLNDIGEKEISARRAGALKGFELAGQEGQNVRTSSTAAKTAATNAIVNMMGFDAADKRNERELASREKVANAEINARKDIANWDNKTKMDVVNATNQMHRDVQEMSGQVSRDVANIHGRYQLQGHNISAGATMGAAQLQRTTQLEKAIIDNRARLVNIEEKAMNAIDAAAAKERAALMALAPSTGPNAEQKKRLEAIDSSTESLKADLRARMNQQISDLGLENVLGPNLLGSGQKKGLGGYTVTRE